MIVEAFFNVFIYLNGLILGLIPSLDFIPQLETGASDVIRMIGTALYFFPLDVWVVLIANIAFWYTTTFGWVLVEWIYKKIPGVE